MQHGSMNDGKQATEMLRWHVGVTRAAGSWHAGIAAEAHAAGKRNPPALHSQGSQLKTTKHQLRSRLPTHLQLAAPHLQRELPEPVCSP